MTASPEPEPEPEPEPGAGPFDVLVIGSGVAGLSAAVRLASGGRLVAGPSAGPGGRGGQGGRGGSGLAVAVMTKGELSQSATRWAQGGVAAVVGEEGDEEDSTDLHLADTLAAGGGLCDAGAVRVLVDEGPARVEELIAMGARFDRERSGSLALAREGGHSRARVVHAGGAATGAEVERALVEVTRSGAAAVLERHFAEELVVEDGRCCGVVARGPDRVRRTVRARHVVLATGGAGQLYAVTTNPPESTGDGIAMALRAGIFVADIEFMQFHPTALHHPAMPRPLLSEALRGEGAILRDAAGERFVDELAPRDVVSRTMAARMAEQGVDHLWLDATGLERFAERFPTIAASVAAIGLDPATDWLPVAPAAHHLSGGVVTDLWGATALGGLWAVGEAACTGVHGANRLASNSLLEGMVFGARCAEAITGGTGGPGGTGVLGEVLRAAGTGRAGRAGAGEIGIRFAPSAAADDGAGAHGPPPAPEPDTRRAQLQQAMTTGAGVVRSAPSLASAQASLGALAASARCTGELRNLLTVAGALLSSATERAESRGAHTRVDHPGTDPAWRRRLVHGRPVGAEPTWAPAPTVAAGTGAT